MAVRIARISDVALDVAAHFAAVDDSTAGAVTSFVGTVRDHDPDASGAVVALEYSAHPDAEQTLLLSGAGDVLEPEGEASSIGSGSGYALAAARALLLATDWDAERIARVSLETAAEICIYTNKSITLEMIGS